MRTKMDNLFINAKTSFIHKFGNRCNRKSRGDETLIVKIMLMIVAVAIVIVFRDGVKTVISNLVTEIGSKTSGMYNN